MKIRKKTFKAIGVITLLAAGIFYNSDYVAPKLYHIKNNAYNESSYEYSKNKNRNFITASTYALKSGFNNFFSK